MPGLDDLVFPIQFPVEYKLPFPVKLCGFLRKSNEVELGFKLIAVLPVSAVDSVQREIEIPFRTRGLTGAQRIELIGDLQRYAPFCYL